MVHPSKPPSAPAEVPSPPHPPVAAALWVPIGLVFLAKLAIVALGVDRGYELGDEGFFLLNLNQPEASPRFFEFYKLLLLLPQPPRFDVTDARWIRIVVELLASAALAAGVFAWARARLGWGSRVPPIAFLSLVSMGALLGAASRSFSYNDATNLCTFGAFGALFQVASLGPRAASGILAPALVAAAGFALGFQLFVKFPPALVSMALIVAALVATFEGRARRRSLAAFAAGIAAALLLFVAANGGVAPLVAKLRLAAEVGALAGYAPAAMIRRSIALEVWTAVNLGILAAAFGAAFFGLRRVLGRSIDRAASEALILAILALAVSVRPLHAAFASASLTALACGVFFAPVLLALLACRVRPDARALLPWWMLLLALPFVLFAGTNVPLVWRLPSHALPLFVAVAVMVCDPPLRSAFPRTGRAVCFALLAATTLVFAQHHVVEPYGLRRPLFEQRSEVAGLPGIRVDLATQRFLEEVRAGMAEAGFRPGDPIVAMDYMPGLVFYLGGRSPGFPFYAFGRPAMNCFNLNRIDPSLRPYLILGRPVSAAQRACVERFALPGEAGPGDFRLIRTVRFPYEDVYASFGGFGISHLELYAPAPPSGASPRGDAGSEKPSSAARASAAFARSGSPNRWNQRPR
ncbi:MAG: hypothetical protein HKP30_07085 [Myxococcales bacterium]|nr:hypothetical protein [Myxococcales bacterium]